MECYCGQNSIYILYETATVHMNAAACHVILYLQFLSALLMKMHAKHMCSNAHVLAILIH